MEARRVGIRELRQNLSVFLRRVMRGETLEVTEHGRPVAVLAPVPRGEGPLERLIASGRALAPSASLSDLRRPSGDVSDAMSRALLDDREDRL